MTGRAAIIAIDVLILTRNEEANIQACLDGAKNLGSFLGEIIIIDDFSSDKTEEIAVNAGAKVIKRALDNFADQRNFALENSLAQWVFFLDADERLSPSLAKSVQTLVSKGIVAAGRLKRRSLAFGTRQRFGPLSPDWVTRLFPRSKVKWQGLVHERPIFNLPVINLTGCLEHHTYSSWPRYLEKMNTYALWWAKEACQTGRSSTPIKALARGGWAFFKMLFGKLGILGGPVTWALCFYYSGYTLSKYLLLADLSKTNYRKG
ncbi:MAG: glycosyltransferase family 2 protein [Deltaproteobacteria bacterium]|jgi:glycosyltransferase involved in cell wall biosynthesis|nr:glycosyltransferase family 2 protein [Deltaproteobacteria bacterium]